MKTAKEECEDLMSEMIPFAKKMLAEHGEFLPFGGMILKTNEIVHAGATDERSDHPASKNLIDILRRNFATRSREGKLKATAIVYDVAVTPPDKQDKMDAIQVDLNHQDGYGISVFLPYVRNQDGLNFTEPFATRPTYDPFNI